MGVFVCFMCACVCVCVLYVCMCVQVCVWYMCVVCVCMCVWRACVHVRVCTRVHSQLATVGFSPTGLLHMYMHHTRLTSPTWRAAR